MTSVKTALIFPGQGSQKIGMGADLYEEFPGYRAVLRRASEILGYDLVELCLYGPEERLSRTEFTQPVVFAASVATHEVLKGGVGPVDYVAGHSLGEYAACAAAGALDFENGLRVVAERARLMEQAAKERPGKMVAVIGLESPAVCEAVAGVDGAWIANYNSPGQVVVSVRANELQALRDALKAAGARKAVEIPVGGAFHCPLMGEASEKFAGFLKGIEIRRPGIPVVMNGTAGPESDPEKIRDALATQLTGPVAWEQSVAWMAAQGVDRFIEVGPGDVLTKLNKKIVPEIESLSTADALVLI